MSKRYKALIQERADLVKEQSALFATIDKEGRAMTAEEQTRDDAIHARQQELAGEIEREERRREWERNVAPAAVGSRVEVGHNNEEDRPWESNGHFLQAVAAAGTPGGHVDPRLYATASGANTSTPSEAGFLVHNDFSTALLESAVQESILASQCIPVEVGPGADGVDLPYIDESSEVEGYDFGGVVVYWRGEADTVAAKMPKFEMHDLRLTELMGLAYATNRALRDATSLESIFSAAFKTVMGRKLDRAIYRGTGAGQPLGMINSAGPRVSQAKEDNQVADTLVAANISKMFQRVDTYSKARGFWLYNFELNAQLDSLYIPAGTAGLNPRTVDYAPDGTYRIKGRPAYEFPYCSAIGDEGDIAFVDPKKYILIKKGGIDEQQSMHVRFIYGENTFRWMFPVNGRPVAKSAKTPAYGTSGVTQSAFVTLAAR